MGLRILVALKNIQGLVQNKPFVVNMNTQVWLMLQELKVHRWKKFHTIFRNLLVVIKCRSMDLRKQGRDDQLYASQLCFPLQHKNAEDFSQAHPP